MALDVPAAYDCVPTPHQTDSEKMHEPLPVIVWVAARSRCPGLSVMTLRPQNGPASTQFIPHICSVYSLVYMCGLGSLCYEFVAHTINLTAVNGQLLQRGGGIINMYCMNSQLRCSSMLWTTNEQCLLYRDSTVSPFPAP